MGKNKATQKTTQKTKTAPSVVVDNTKLKLTLAWKEIKQAYDRVLKNSAKNIKAQGFRQGKVPLKIAEEKIGRDHLINKVLEVIVPQKYQDLIKKEKKEPLTPPEIKPLKMDWEQDFELEIYIAEKPIIKLGNYRQAVKKGLKAAIKQFKEHTKEPKDGKKLTKAQLNTQEREIKLQQIFKALLEATQPQIPELLLKEETKREIQRLDQELKKIGLSLDDYLTKRNQKFEDMSSQVAIQSLSQLQLEFVLEAIEQDQKIKVTQKDIDVELRKIKDEKVKQQIQNNHQYLNYLEAQINRRKLIDLLLETK
ncbi:hypothetical protein KJ707_01350 [Patescibacteria group bacterium]|nr:hypothetical protein [Patescibacteria group bacterium]